MSWLALGGSKSDWMTYRGGDINKVGLLALAGSDGQGGALCSTLGYVGM